MSGLRDFSAVRRSHTVGVGSWTTAVTKAVSDKQEGYFMRFVSSIAITVALASAASADVSFSLGFDTEDMAIRTIEYECDKGQPFVVHYFTSESDVLALVPVDEDHRVFVNVVSASGARYVSGRYEWWTKGENVTLTDTIKEESLLQCTPNNE